MKGLIIYSSKTGNTKHMAEIIYEEIKNIADVDLVDIKEYEKGTAACPVGIPSGLSPSKDHSSPEKAEGTVPCGLSPSDNHFQSISTLDFILLGAWIDRGTLENKAMKLFKTIQNKKIGLFATLGAMPDSEHGKKVINNLQNILVDKDSLGQYICPGLVDPKMIEKLKGITGLVVPKHIKEKMIETSLNSRYATEEELQKAAIYFRNKLKETN